MFNSKNFCCICGKPLQTKYDAHAECAMYVDPDELGRADLYYAEDDDVDVVLDEDIPAF